MNNDHDSHDDNNVDKLDFTLELSSEHLCDQEEARLYETAEERLLDLAGDHNDIIGAAIRLRLPAHTETAFLHEATVTVYGRPSNVAATEKESNAELALKHALDAIERQIRERRKKLNSP